MMLSKEQCKAARALLNMTQGDLAAEARVAVQTIVDFERDQRKSYDRTLADIQKALEQAGVAFIEESSDGGLGVRLK